jgi:hypothetical protein
MPTVASRFGILNMVAFASQLRHDSLQRKQKKREVNLGII